MTVIQGNITDVGGDDPTGWINIRAYEPRPNEDGTATVGTALFPIRVSNGVISPKDVDPGPCVVQVTVGTWNHRYERVMVPDQDEPIDFWELVQNDATFEPWVISAVHADRLAAEAAAAEAVATAESISDISAQVAEVDADRVAAEAAATAAGEHESGAALSALAASDSADEAAASALTVDGVVAAAEAARDAALTAETNAETAETNAETAATTATTKAGEADASASAAATSETNAAGSAADAAQSAQDAADVVASGVPNATTTTKGGIILAGDLGGTYDAPTVPELADKAELVHTHAITSVVGLEDALNEKLDQAAVDARVEVGTSALVDQAPTTLDTLNELAQALGDDPNFATTTAAAIGEKYTKPGTGIPESDLDSAVQASLGKADTAAQPADITGLQDQIDLRLEGEVVDTLPGSPVTGRIYFVKE